MLLRLIGGLPLDATDLAIEARIDDVEILVFKRHGPAWIEEEFHARQTFRGEVKVVG